MTNKTITLKFINYRVVGKVEVTLWDGSQGFITMNPFNVEDIKDIPNHINDGGFGVQTIDKAHVAVYENYQGYCTNPIELTFETKDLINAKIGI